MEILRVPFEKVPQFSEKDIAYATDHPALTPFKKYPVTLDAFEKVIQDKSQDRTDRQTLVEVLREQYAQLDHSALTHENIDALLSEHTFTVTTAHQPSLCTGPLYYIYKIASAIHLARLLNKQYPKYRIVPIFIVGAEDHDFEEINHFHLFNKTITWENEETGAVGMMNTDSLQPILQELKEILGHSDQATQVFQLIEKAYTQNATYEKAAIQLTNALFSKYGLVVLGMNHPKLKQVFKPHLQKELIERPSKALVEQTTEELVTAGFSGQAHARDINLFYLKPQMRARIVPENGHYQVLDTDISFTETALLEEVDQHPEHFSPNVVMRPIYQETILPNLAYIGGGGEISYWLERKPQFEHFGLNFPMLIRRNSVLWIDKGTHKKMDKLNLSLDDLFVETEALIKQFVKANTDNEVSLSTEKEQLESLFNSIVAKANDIDPTVAKKAQAEHAKQLKGIEQLEGRLMRAEKQKHETALNQIRGLKDKLFPNNGLQERYDNFLSLYLKYGDSFFDVLVENLNPLEKGMIVVSDQ